MRKQAALIVPYFGSFPKYFDLFMLSCEKNQEFDWLIFTDNDYNSYFKPKNVKIMKMDWYELVDIIERKLNTKFRYKLRPYKLCDLKPAYGFIFSDFLNDYSYWGHCDIDLIFGSISDFLNFDELHSYDKLFVSGHFSLYKNTEEVNKYFYLKAPLNLSFEDALLTEENIYFDEIWFVNILTYHQKRIYSNCNSFLDILPQFPNFRPLQFLNEKLYKDKLYFWENGKIKVSDINAGMKSKLSEFMYIHLQKRELPVLGSIDRFKNGFMITPYGFFNLESVKQMSTDQLKRIYRGTYRQTLLYYYNRLKRISFKTVQRTILKHFKPEIYLDPCQRELLNRRKKVNEPCMFS